MNPHVERIILNLRAGRITEHTGFGNSMLPVIRSGQRQTIVPILSDADATRVGAIPFAPSSGYRAGDLRYLKPDQIREGDAVFCKVGGNVYTHKVRAIRGPSNDLEFQISRQDERRINGWTRLVYGKCVRVQD